MSAADFMADTDDSDVMSVSDHAGGLTMQNQAVSSGSPTRSLFVAWIAAWGAFWLLHFIFKGQLS